jgi:mannonate dehydratase
MHVGDQNFGVTKLELEFLTRHGVCHIDANRGLPKPLTLKAMIAHRAAAAEYGVSLEMIHVLPGRAVILGRDPERDVEIEEFKRKIEIAGRSGLRGLNYSFGTLENQRTPDKTGRGGATYSSLDWSEYDDSPVDDDRAGTTVDQIFERIRYFHERVVPVAEHWKVQLACHLDDPPAPSLRGVARWDFPVFEGEENGRTHQLTNASRSLDKRAARATVFARLQEIRGDGGLALQWAELLLWHSR